MPAPDESSEKKAREEAFGHGERLPEDTAPADQRHATVSSTKVSDAEDDGVEDEEKVLAGRQDANMPALLTKDVPGG